MLRDTLFLFSFIVFCISSNGGLCVEGDHEVSPHYLLCEYRTNPLGIEELHPRLSWWLPKGVKRQTAYRLLVTSDVNLLNEENAEVWDSGKVESDQSIHVEYAGMPLHSGERYYWKVKVWDGNGRESNYSPVAYWQMGLLAPEDWKARWIGYPRDLPENQVRVVDEQTGKTQTIFTPPSPSPMLRHVFTLRDKPIRATIYTTALGLYELHLNGQKVGNRILAPEWTDYHQRIQYQTYDVTHQLHSGNNAIGAILGEGWYAGLVGLVGTRQYGSQLGFLLQMEIEFADGSKKTIISDEFWKGTIAGPIRGSDLIRGETYDARMEMPGWDTTNFNDQTWIPVVRLPAVEATLTAQANEPIRITQELKPVAISEPKPGTFVYDIGQNMVGWCRFQIRGSTGQTIELRHGEALNSNGTVYWENLRGNKPNDPVKEYQKNTYICSGSEGEFYEPHFTYQGFRYVEVSGLPYRPRLEDLQAYVFHSDAPIGGTFACSNADLNQLMENILWTLRGNLHSTPTDCPQRDERLGWMGDAQLFSQAVCFLMNMAPFYTKWCQDIRDAQADDGRFSDFSPNPVKDKESFLGAPAWADAGVIIPWRIYENYGDRRILERHFEAATRWIEYLQDQNPERIWQHSRGNDYGDWLNGDWLILENWPKEGANTPKEIFATAFWAYSTELVAKMAKVLGREHDQRRYSDLAKEIKAAFNYHYVQPDGRIEGDTQTIYALALHFDLLPEGLRDAAVRHLLRKIGEYNRSVSTGIQGTNRMMLELTNNGYTDVAYDLLLNRSVPSWLYMIDQGATTIWERWDGWVEGRGFQNPGMNSFNHYALGAVGEWMVRTILGIQPVKPAYRHFVIQPRPGGKLTYAKGRVETLYGPIEVAWDIQEERLTLCCTVPPGTTATVYVPVTEDETLEVIQGEIRNEVKKENGFYVCDVQADTYHFCTAYHY